MDRQHRIIVDLAVQILRRAAVDAGAAPVDTVPVRLALCTLWTHCPERWPLVTSWESAGQPNEIGRAQGTTAGFNAIVRQLRKSGAYQDAANETRELLADAVAVAAASY
jgi:hypothetical protein